ncbi:hypothetical protein PM082_018482 [Marasmius tenuissimus]|nr:hypothetical protein PM082_018482 [Marasmius tenuissimus]
MCKRQEAERRIWKLIRLGSLDIPDASGRKDSQSSSISSAKLHPGNPDRTVMKSLI